MQALQTPLLQVGSSDDPDSSADYAHIARDLAALADEAMRKEWRINGRGIRMCVYFLYFVFEEMVC